MPTFLEATVDKFIFRVAEDRLYSRDGFWAKHEDGLVRIGLSDFAAQRSGDVAFAEVKPVGEEVSFGEEAAQIETIKLDLSVTSPVGGVIREVNPALEDAPEVINLAPYEAGWLAVIEPTNWEADLPRLLDAKAYFVHMKIEAEEEAQK